MLAMTVAVVEIAARAGEVGSEPIAKPAIRILGSASLTFEAISRPMEATRRKANSSAFALKICFCRLIRPPGPSTPAIKTMISSSLRSVVCVMRSL